MEGDSILMTTKSSKMDEKMRKIRKDLWPEVNDDMVWGEKFKKGKIAGYVQCPRTLPHFFKIITKEP